ncbi:LysR family transcriptional regulator [Embleya sp. AB8]|uniref:LysR family transcriptional regulator n=1 Tax=Embleya sp. AB8 TaxID=3156304 RepID=UPI003C778E18
MAVNLAQLRALVAVLDTGGFGTAATTLGISQSAVSHAVAALERALGAPVVDRGAPGARPTPLGELVLPHARRAVAAADAVVTLAARERAGAVGTVLLAATPTACRGLVPGLIRRWGRAHSGIRVRVFEGEDAEVAGWLADGTADLAVLVDADPVPEGAVPLLRDEFRAALPADHPLAQEDSITLSDLDDDRFLLSDGGCEPYLRELHRLGGTPYVPPPRIRGFATLLAMVGDGLGVSVVPDLARHMLPPGVVLVPLKPSVHRRLTLSGPPSRPWPPTVRALLDSTTPAGR